jgi:hypothetical protein
MATPILLPWWWKQLVSSKRWHPSTKLNTITSRKTIHLKFYTKICTWILEVRGSVVDWGTVLQGGRSRVQFPMRSLDFFCLPNPSSHTISLGSTQPLTEMSTSNLPRGKERPARKADNLTAICELTVWKMWEPRHLTTLWAFTACYRDSFTVCTWIL